MSPSPPLTPPLPDPDPGSGSDSAGVNRSPGRWRAFTRHPIFPIIVFILISQVVKEFYPFSHFSMYSKPSSRPLRYCYLADGEGQPLPVTWHTGLSPSRMYKVFGHYKGKMGDRQDETGRSSDDIKAEAGATVLAYLDGRAEKRKGRELPPKVQFIEVTIIQTLDGFEETERMLAEIDTTVDRAKAGDDDEDDEDGNRENEGDGGDA